MPNCDCDSAANVAQAMRTPGHTGADVSREGDWKMDLVGDDGSPPATRLGQALDELSAGRFVLVVDDEDRENEGDLILAAEHATADSIAFMLRHTSGLLCVGMEPERLDALALPLMVGDGDDPRGTAFTVSVDLRHGTSTGISAADRAVTVRALADAESVASDFTRPGHVFPLRARAGGVLKRAGHTESAVDLCRLAALHPAGLLAEVTNDDGTVARLPKLRAFAAAHSIPLLHVADIVRHRLATESLTRCTSSGRVPTRYGVFTASTHVSLIDGVEHVALTLGDVSRADEVLVRVHSECLTADVFGSLRCDCGEQLQLAMAAIGEAGCGVVVYLRGHEGRGVGLAHKLRAYQLQDTGLDTVDANLALGLPVDSREYGIGAQILRSLGATRIRLMTNNPAKYRGLTGYGISIVGRVALVVAPNEHNLQYLHTKATRMQHELTEDLDRHDDPTEATQSNNMVAR